MGLYQLIKQEYVRPIAYTMALSVAMMSFEGCKRHNSTYKKDDNPRGPNYEEGQKPQEYLGDHDKAKKKDNKKPNKPKNWPRFKDHSPKKKKKEVPRPKLPRYTLNDKSFHNYNGIEFVDSYDTIDILLT